MSLLESINETIKTVLQPDFSTWLVKAWISTESGTPVTGVSTLRLRIGFMAFAVASAARSPSKVVLVDIFCVSTVIKTLLASAFTLSIFPLFTHEAITSTVDFFEGLQLLLNIIIVAKMKNENCSRFDPGQIERRTSDG